MIQIYEELYERSKALLDAYPNLTTNAIPDDLLEAWIYNGEIEVDAPSGLLFAVLIYKYIDSQHDIHKLDPGVDRNRFELVQYALAAEWACRKVGAKLRPRRVRTLADDKSPLNLDLKRNQIRKFEALAAKIIPLKRGTRR